jgi:hypothetical protein
MRAPKALVMLMTALAATAGLGQQQDPPGLGEVLVTANRQNVPYAQADRPVVGLRRRADAAVMQLTITSDSREETTRQQEIHTVLLAALDRAAASGLELVSGSVVLGRVTKANYKDLPFQYAGRADTGRVDLLVKAKLEGSAADTRNRLHAFILGLKGSGRAVIGTSGSIALTVVNPDQYRDEIIGLVAADGKHMSALFGPQFNFNVTGIDGQVSWSQVSSTEVFLYIPYRFVIFPK